MYTIVEFPFSVFGTYCSFYGVVVADTYIIIYWLVVFFHLPKVVLNWMSDLWCFVPSNFYLKDVKSPTEPRWQLQKTFQLL